MSGHMKQKLQDKGIVLSNVPIVLITFKVINFVIYGGMLALCYKKHPLINLSNKYKLEQTLLTKYPQFHARSSKFITNSIEKISKNQWYAKFVNKCNLNPENTIKSTVEASVLYKLCLPVIFPLSFYGSFKLFEKK
jgi:hypothetical protein